MNAIRRLFGPTLASVQTANPARQRLRDAIAAQARAKETLNEALAGADRVRALTAHARDAADAAAAAEDVAAQATRIWAETGASSGTAPASQRLLDAAAAARRKASDARLTAEGAAEGMSAVEENVRAARVELDNAGFDIKTAVAAVLMSESEGKFEVLERAHREYVEALADIKALLAVVRGGGPAHIYHDTRSDSTAQAITQRLSRSAIPLLVDGDLRSRSNESFEFARRLRSDPDAAHEKN